MAVLVAVVWIGSIWYECSLQDSAMPPHRFVIGEGCIRYYHYGFSDRVRVPPKADLSFRQTMFHTLQWLPAWKFGGPPILTPTAPTQLEMLDVPLWPLAPMLGVPYVVSFWSSRREAKRDRQRLCPKCNYDRRGLTPDAPCPECGKPPP